MFRKLVKRNRFSGRSSSPKFNAKNLKGSRNSEDPYSSSLQKRLDVKTFCSSRNVSNNMSVVSYSEDADVAPIFVKIEDKIGCLS